MEVTRRSMTDFSYLSLKAPPEGSGEQGIICGSWEVENHQGTDIPIALSHLLASTVQFQSASSATNMFLMIAGITLPVRGNSLLFALTLAGSDPGMLKKMDPPALVLTQTDPIDR